MLSENMFRASRILAGLALAVACLASDGALRGRLAPPVAGEPLHLVAADGATVELALDESLERTMRDPQLAERLWEVRGRRLDDGRFSTDKIFTVKDGELYRVTYYCEICHITTHEPGRCMCCQDETYLRELKGE